MRIPPFDQYAALFAMVAGACARGLRMIAQEEERRSRDDVLIALVALREAASQNGVALSSNLVLSVFQEQTNERAPDVSLTTLVNQAAERKMKRSRSSAFDVVDNALDFIEKERKGQQ